MADLGLTTRPSGHWPREQAVSDSKLHKMLSDSYYADGWVIVDRMANWFVVDTCPTQS